MQCSGTDHPTVDTDDKEAESCMDVYFNSKTVFGSERSVSILSANLSLTSLKIMTLSGSSLIQNALNSKNK